jgi:hypothetical protein
MAGTEKGVPPDETSGTPRKAESEDPRLGVRRKDLQSRQANLPLLLFEFFLELNLCLPLQKVNNPIWCSSYFTY